MPGKAGWVCRCLGAAGARVLEHLLGSPGIYESSQTRLAEIFANEASIAIENARLFQQVQQMAITDELTCAYNRRYFFELVDLELARSRRYNHPVSLLMIDVDLFKTINDRYGHATGDQVLKAICAEIDGAVRESDTLGRYGGENSCCCCQRHRSTGRPRWRNDCGRWSKSTR